MMLIDDANMLGWTSDEIDEWIRIQRERRGQKGNFQYPDPPPSAPSAIDHLQISVDKMAQRLYRLEKFVEETLVPVLNYLNFKAPFIVTPPKVE